MLFKFILFLSIYFLIKKVIVNFLSKIVLRKFKKKRGIVYEEEKFE